MRCLLINPSWLTLVGYEDRVRVPYPIGLAYIAAVLEKNGHEVKIIDALAIDWKKQTRIDNETIKIGISDKELVSIAKEFSPEIIGITCMFTTQADSMYRTVSLIKSEFRKIPIIVGGAHVSSSPEEVMKNKNIDFAVVGEGEETIKELVDKLERNKKINKVKGIYYRKDKKTVFSGKRNVILDLDSIPFPAYHLLPMEKYFEAGAKGKSSRAVYSKKWASIITSRGCPHACYFCSIHGIYGRRWRSRTPENVLDELEFLYKNYSIRHFFFEDDNMTLDMNRAENIFNGILKRGLKISWETPNGIRADGVDENLARKMKESGCVGLTIGIESGDQEFLEKVICKNLNLDDVEKAIKIITKFKIPLNGFFILGMAGETKESLEKTLNFAKRLARIGLVPVFSIAVPLPGTDMYRICKENKLLTKNEIKPMEYLVGYSEPLIKIKDLTSEEIVQFRRKAIKICLKEMFLHNPLLFLKRRGVINIIKNPTKIIKRFKIIMRGTS